MQFPDTWEEFEQAYGFEDKKEIYTNGSRLIQSFRVKQWLDHIELDKLRDKYGETSQITCPKCHSEFVILPDANNPLTWDELKQMEGKPVWIEVDNHLPGRKRTKYKNWEVIDMIAEDLILVKGDYSYQKDEFGDVWQAYRKERS